MKQQKYFNIFKSYWYDSFKNLSVKEYTLRTVTDHTRVHHHRSCRTAFHATEPDGGLQLDISVPFSLPGSLLVSVFT